LVRKGTIDSEDIQNIDEIYPNDFNAIKDNSGVDFAGICYNKLVTVEKKCWVYLVTKPRTQI